MDSDNNMQRNQSMNDASTSGSMDPGSLSGISGNNDFLFSTIRDLATRNTEIATVTTNGFYNTTNAYPSLPMSLSDQNPNNFSSNSLSTNTSAPWLDQAKFSLLPMYGMFQSSLNSSEMCRRNNLPWMDSNIQQAAVAAVAFNAAASLNAMQNLPSFGHLGPSSAVGLPISNYDFQRSNSDSTFGSPSNDALKKDLQSPPQGVGAFQRQTTSSCYSQSTTSTSHTPQSIIGTSMQGQTIALSPDEGQAATKMTEFSNQRENMPTVMEELSGLDLQDFEDFFMEKPSTSMQETEIRPAEKPAEYRTDELKSADIELDRLVSLVASQNNKEIAESQQRFVTTKFDGPKNESISLSDAPVFELPQFTPPDSPSERPSTSYHSIVQANIENKHFEPSGTFILPLLNCSGSVQKNKLNKGTTPTVEENLVLIPKEIKSEMTVHQPNLTLNKVALARRNANKLPIYKQSACSSQNKINSKAQLQSENDRKQNGDEYSFECEEEELSSSASCSFSELLMGAKHSSEGREHKIGRDEEQHKPKRRYSKHHNSSATTTAQNVKIAEKNSITVNSILAERTKQRAGTRFITSELAIDAHSVLTDIPIPTCTLRNSSSSNENACLNSCTTTPVLPKLVIRFPKRENSMTDESKHSIHKEKKRKKREKDVDWTETKEWHGARTKEKHRKEKKHRKSHHKKRNHSTETDERLPYDVPMDQSNSCDLSDDLQSRPSAASSFQNEAENAELFARLNFFERPTERPRRGTFLLPKEDIFNSSCALWRIDNQNLLQKYLPIILDGVTCYQNSSTYSGWCEHYVDDYLAVKVDYVKQSRSENIVRPILPLGDLFPATNFAADDENCFGHTLTGDGIERRGSSSATEQQFRNTVNIFVKMMLKHAVSLRFVQHVRQNKDWGYLCALTEIESMVGRSVQNIRDKTPFWSRKFVDSLQYYPLINTAKQLDDNHCWGSCQACSSGDREITSAIQLFGLEEQYDYETLAPVTCSNYDTIATDFYVCDPCQHFALSYHKAYHLCFHILKSAEEKLELFSAKYTDNSVTEIISKCLGDKEWLNQIADSVLYLSKNGINEK